MKNKKQLILMITAIILLSLFCYPIFKFLKSKNPSKMTTYSISNSFAAATKDSTKITLLDAYDAVISVLGKPNAISESQSMFNPGNPDPFAGDSYMKYDNFLVMLRENKVAGWYFDAKNPSDKINLFYLPGLKSTKTGNFFDMYQVWDSIDTSIKPDISKVFTILNDNLLGELQFCFTWGWDANSKNIAFMEFSFFDKNYKIAQQYFFNNGALVSKSIQSENLSLIKNEKKGNFVFLGEKLESIKAFLGTKAILVDPKKYSTFPTKDTTVTCYKKENISYYFTFDKNGECIRTQLECWNN